MLERTTTRALPVVSRAVDLAPAAQTCCGVCRACATTNLIGLAVTAFGGIGLYLGRLARRVARPS